MASPTHYPALFPPPPPPTWLDKRIIPFPRGKLSVFEVDGITVYQVGACDHLIIGGSRTPKSAIIAFAAIRASKRAVRNEPSSRNENNSSSAIIKYCKDEICICHVFLRRARVKDIARAQTSEIRDRASHVRRKKLREKLMGVRTTSDSRLLAGIRHADRELRVTARRASERAREQCVDLRCVEFGAHLHRAAARSIDFSRKALALVPFPAASFCDAARALPKTRRYVVRHGEQATARAICCKH